MICPFISFLSIVVSGYIEQKCSTTSPYSSSPLKLGIEVFGIDLNQDISPETVARLKEDLWKHRILVFRNQGIISGERYVEIAHWFGEIDSSDVVKHNNSPSPLIARFSNDPSEGLCNIGRAWHVDGIYRMYPYSISFYHIVSLSRNGNTKFVGLREVINSISPVQKQEWDRLWVTSIMRPIPTNPLIYQHPIRNEQTLSINLNRIKQFIVDLGSDSQRITNKSETNRIIHDIQEAIIKDDEQLIYSHKWKKGDLIMTDNLALGHKSTDENHLPVFETGLRVLHRITLQGTYKPSKRK